jgi:16S rRNA (guanine(527)-N(7))-methyltransferase RsmG
MQRRPHPASRSGPPPSPQRLRGMLAGAGIRLDEQALDRLWRYHTLLRSRNDDRDLTRIVGFEPMVIKHYVDCLIVGDLFALPSPLLDIGTGAGLPGIPLAIRYPKLHITLAEPRPRRVAFLNEARAALELRNTEVFEHKVSSRSFQRPMAAVITRALEPMEKTLARTAGCTGIGARYIFMKGPNADDDLRQVRQRFGNQLRLLLDRSYVLPRTPHQRRLIVFERLTPAAASADEGD